MPDIDPLLEKHDSISELEADANTAMQSYPSPNAEGRDNGPFYHAAPRQDDQLQDDLNPHPGEHGQLEGPPTPRQGVRAISSAEELQLAAQLSQGLAHGIPMMDHNEEANLQAMAQQEMDQQQQELQQQQQHEAQLDHDHEHMHHDGLAEHHNGLPEPHDGLSHHHDGLSAQDDHVNDHLHEQIHEQPYEHEHDQVMAHAQHDQHLQHDHQHEQPQHDVQHQYMPDQHQHQHLQPAATMESMPSPFHTPDSNIPPRKRSKVSRACDECRRKKVKCDAPSETGDEPCSNCRRSNMQCLFSRIPQKRGPSKGYIKELADRIHSIEGKLASEGANADLSELFNGTRREPSDLFVSTDNSGRKRPYSSISSGDFDTPTPAGHITSNLEHRPVYRSSDDRYRAPYSANELAPAPNTANADADTFARPEVALNGMQVDMDPMDQLPEIDETTFAA